MDTHVNIKNSIPLHTIYFIPIPESTNPPIAVPILMPQFEQDTNRPFAKSGASGAADVIQN